MYHWIQDEDAVSAEWVGDYIGDMAAAAKIHKAAGDPRWAAIRA